MLPAWTGCIEQVLVLARLCLPKALTKLGATVSILTRLVFATGSEHHLLSEIEKSADPLDRLARWQDGARSALCVTGDIGALTLGDCGLRMFGK